MYDGYEVCWETALGIYKLILIMKFSELLIMVDGVMWSIVYTCHLIRTQKKGSIK